jgi:hypothetical protein
MSGWKKLASAFVDFEDNTPDTESSEDSEFTSTDDVDALLKSLDVTTGEVTTEAAVTTPLVAVLPGIQADKPFSEIYSAHGVVPAPKTAEEVLAILEGMSALPPEVRKISLDAMDKADDNWSMDDVKLDASNKVEALSAYKMSLDVALEQARTNKESDIASTDQYVENATKTIRDQIEQLQAQIAECQTLLQQEIVEATQKKADIKNDFDSVVTTHASECARIDSEIERLRTI